MYIYEHLKKLRQETNQTLQKLADKVGYGTGNLSSYETGKLKAKDPTIIRILTKGYGMTQEKAKQKLAMWRKEEIETQYNLQLAQNTTSYNEKTKKVSLDDFLKNEGLSSEEVKAIKMKIKEYKNKN